MKSLWIVLSLVWTISAVPADLLSGPKCGDIRCPFLEYCNTLENRCSPCSSVCDRNSHNFDETLCKDGCQDYLRDLRYSKDGSDENLPGTVQSLSRLVTVTLTLVCFMLVVLACLLSFQLYRYKQKKNITLATIKNKLFGKKPDNTDETKANNTEKMENKQQRPELRLEMGTPTIGSQSEHNHSPVTVTTSISRKPAEDSALDYAYDNPAMTSTPSPR